MAERTLALALAASVLAPGCGGGDGDGGAADGPPPWLAEEAAARGLVFEHRSGHRPERYLFPELMGGGAALFDLEGDGDLDVFLVQSGSLYPGEARGEHALFANRGDGTFEDVSAGAGVATGGYGIGVTAGDADGDGDVDLYVTQIGPNTFLRNEGGGRFVDATAETGLGDPRWGTSACFFDYDGDRDLDLFIANYVDWSEASEQDCFDPTGLPDYCSPVAYEAPTRDTLYRNDGGVFVDVTQAAGMAQGFGNGLGAVPGDFDGDGDLDLFVANDQTPDQLWLNQGDGTFRDAAELWGCARDSQGGVRAGMGVDAADVDDDDDLDLVVVHMARETDGFFENAGTHFVEKTALAGLGMASIRFTRFGVGFVDLDLDGWLDLYVANGRVNLMQAPLDEDDPYAEPNLLLRGGPDGRWRPVEPAGGTARPLLFTSRGAAFGDLDGDGALDVVVANRDAPAHLFMNVVPGRGHWLIARLVDEAGRDPLGASARFRVGERWLRRDVKPAGSYQSASDPRLHVGLGDAERVEQVRVRWPDGARESFGPFAADQIVELRQGSGRAE